MKLLIKGLTMIQKVFVYISSFFMALVAIFVFYEVVARYVFNAPTIWANELSIYMMQFLVFFSMGYLLIQDDHIKVTFLIEKVKGIKRVIIQIITKALVIPYAYILVIYGLKYTKNSYKMEMVSPTLLEFPLWIPYSFIFGCGLLLILGSLGSILKIIIGDEPINSQEEAGA